MIWTKGLNINTKRKVRKDILNGYPLDKILCKYDDLERGQLKYILSYMSDEELMMREQNFDNTSFTHVCKDREYGRGRVIKVFKDCALGLMKFEFRKLPTMVNLKTFKTVHLDKRNKVFGCLEVSSCES